MHKNPKVPKSAKLAPRDRHCQYLIKQGSIVWVSVSLRVCTCRGGIGTFIWYFFIVKSYWYYWRLPWQGEEQHGLESGGGIDSLPWAGSLCLCPSKGAEMPGCPSGQELRCCWNARTIEAAFPLCRQGSVNGSTSKVWNPPAPRCEQQIFTAAPRNRNRVDCWSNPWCFWDVACSDGGSGKCMRSHKGHPPPQITPAGWWTGYLDKNIEGHNLRCGTCRPGLEEL